MKLIRFVLGLALLAPLAGCAQPVVQVSGVVTRDGAPVTASSSDTIDLLFQWTSDGGANMSATCNFNPADGTFSVVGPGGQGVPPGEYRIALTGQKYPPTGTTRDLFGGEFAPAKSPLRYTVTTDPHQRIVIDLSKKTVAPQ